MWRVRRREPARPGWPPEWDGHANGGAWRLPAREARGGALHAPRAIASFSSPSCAGVAELADASDSKSEVAQATWGFDPPLRHHHFNDLRRLTSSPTIAKSGDCAGTVRVLTWSEARRATPSARSASETMASEGHVTRAAPGGPSPPTQRPACVFSRRPRRQQRHRGLVITGRTRRSLHQHEATDQRTPWYRKPDEVQPRIQPSARRARPFQ